LIVCLVGTYEHFAQYFPAAACDDRDRRQRQEHSTPAGDLDEETSADAVKYLKVRLGVEKRSREMKLAKINGRCRELPERKWRTL